jgi:hypothetical protein
VSHLIDLLVNALISISNRAFVTFLVVASVVAVAAVVVWLL